MANPIVTIIIATYNRPDVLKLAINTIINQTITSWKLFVIGDNCDLRTGELLAKYRDSRISYINLPERFGEQSGPNSVGLALANTPYLAYLNHDDVWLPDHLENGLSVMAKKEYQFYIGGSAFSHFVTKNSDQFNIYVNDINTKRTRRAFNFFTRHNVNDYEPVSSWMFTSEVRNTVGYWNSYINIYRPPIEDFLLRTWKKGYKFYFSPKITTWHLLMHYKNNSANFYNHKGDEYRDVENIILSNSGDEIRSILNKKHLEWQNLSGKQKKEIFKEFDWVSSRFKIWMKTRKFIKLGLLNRLTAMCFKYLHIDIFVIFCRVLNIQKGFMMQKVLKKRAAIITLNPDLHKIINEIKANNNLQADI